MAAVAIRFIARFATATESRHFTFFILGAIGALHGDVPVHQQRAVRPGLHFGVNGHLGNGFFLVVHEEGKCPAWTFLHLLYDALGAGALRLYPRALPWVEDLGQARGMFPADGGMDTGGGFPDDGDFAVGVVLGNVFVHNSG